MSNDSLIDRLSRFTPATSGLDRDAVLFAAGRASARSGRRWLALAGILGVTQLLTLGVTFWPKTMPPAPPTLPASPPSVLVEPDEEPPSAAELRSLRDRVLASEGLLPEPLPGELVTPAGKPLRAFAPFPNDLLN